MAWVAVAGIGVGVAGKIFSSVKAAKAAKANQAIVNEQLGEAKADANRSFLDTSAAKDAIRVQQDNLVDERKNVAGRAAITGASDEAVVAGNTGINKNYADAVGRLAGMGTDYQERAKARKNQILGVQMGINNQKAESAANLSEAASDIMSGTTMLSGMNTPGAGKVSTSAVQDTSKFTD